MVALLKERGMWEMTLMVYSSDNGGVTMGKLQGNNYPLRGEKHSNWRGGYRVAAFIAGGMIPTGLRGTTSNLRVHVVDWYPTFCALAGVAPTDGSPVPPLPVDPADPTRDIWGNASWPDIDGTDVWALLTDPGSRGGDWAAHPTLWISAQVLLNGSTKLLVGQGNVDDSGEKTPTKDGWRYPNGSWVPQPPSWKCGLSYKPGDAYLPCLFDEADLREMQDIAPANPDVVAAMWGQINRTNLGAFTARSPASLLGPCNPECAASYWKSRGSRSGDGPTCGVPTCGPSPGPSPPTPPSPPVPPPPPRPPGPPGPPGPGPFEPLPHQTNCTVKNGLGSHDGAIEGQCHDQDCCGACFQSSKCVLATLVGSSCFLHATLTRTLGNPKSVGLISGRVPFGGQ